MSAITIAIAALLALLWIAATLADHQIAKGHR